MSFSFTWFLSNVIAWSCEEKGKDITLQVLYKYIYTFIIARIPLLLPRRIDYRELAAGVARPFDDDLYCVSS